MQLKKIVISILIVFQLSVVLLTPNQFSYLTISLKGFLGPYTNMLAINTLWQFFSPDPAPAMFYEYQVMDHNGKKETYHFPPLSGPSLFRESYSRKIALMRVSFQFSDLFKLAIVPLLCRMHPEAQSLDIAVMSIKAPSLTDVEAGVKLNDMAVREYKNMGDFGCIEDGVDSK